MGSYEARRQNVHGVFNLGGDVRGKTVVVVDDVATSGSTLMEATQILHHGGAQKVIPIGLSYHPDNLTALPEALNCPQCGGNVGPLLRKRRKAVLRVSTILFFGMQWNNGFLGGDTDAE